MNMPGWLGLGQGGWNGVKHQRRCWVGTWDRCVIWPTQGIEETAIWDGQSVKKLSYEIEFSK